MMNVQLDKTLVRRTRRRIRKDELTFDERMAIHWFRKNDIKIAILAKVFGMAKNTLYYKALTGDADSYPNSPKSNSVADIKALFDELGMDEVERRYVTNKMKKAMNAAMAEEAKHTVRSGPRMPRQSWHAWIES
jgi:hypothetical protein